MEEPSLWHVSRIADTSFAVSSTRDTSSLLNPWSSVDIQVIIGRLRAAKVISIVILMSLFKLYDCYHLYLQVVKILYIN